MRIALTILLSAIVLSPLTAYGIDVWGDQWGTWTRENSPYNVVGEIRVPPESTLIIEPGVVVDFQGYYSLLVDSLATLLAVGNETDSVVFTCDTLANPDRWHGIRFIYADSNSQVSYCRLEYGKATGSGEDQKGGAIYCSYSSPTITNNSLRGNSAEFGGAIYCYKRRPMIRDNAITGNIAGYGGGICAERCGRVTIVYNLISQNRGRGAGVCFMVSHGTLRKNTITDNFTLSGGGGVLCSYSSNPVIEDNIINANSAWWGGGISSSHSEPWIHGNTITGNSASAGGGGIDCTRSSNPIIEHNTVADNHSDEYGGGISCHRDCQPTIRYNTICGNSATNGGGIACHDSSGAPEITNNTISGNSADFGGGGIYCARYSSPIVVNTILWGDTAPLDPEIHRTWNCDPEVTYCDVQGGWEGQGNIDVDPLFVDPVARDFHLQLGSPCINAGDPNSPPDPDGTRADMGAFFFDHIAEVTITPKNPPIRIPPEGGTFRFEATITNLTDTSLNGEVWTMANVPGIGYYGPLIRQPLRLSPHQTIHQPNVAQQVPGLAPAGVYYYIAYLGNYPSVKVDSSSFSFVKTGKSTGGNWSVYNWFEETPELSLPVETSLLGNHPNPFNASTIISYQLAVDGYVTVQVYNTFGQKVATLVDEKQAAGQKSVDWDASELSSGVYFYKLTAGDFTETRRMMLVK